MTPEVREKYNAKLNRIKKNRRILKIAAVIIFAAVVVCGLSVTVLFNISEIKVPQTGSKYTAEQIISASGLDIGNNMLRTDFDSTGKRIEKNLPYVLSVEIKKTLSGVITISVTDDKASVIFKTGDGYALADDNGKILEILKEEPENNNYMRLETKEEINAVTGSIITFADNDEKNLYSEIKTALSGSGLDGITEIDISDPTDVYLIYQNRFRLHIGTPTELKEKFDSAVKTISMEDKSNPNGIGEINLTIVKKVYVKPLDSLEQ